MRLFVALDTPAEVRGELVRVRDSLRASRADVRWEADEKLHCTLKFIGEFPEPQAAPLADALAAAAARTEPFEIRYAGTGCFPDRRRPRIIWAGIEDGKGRLKELSGTVDRTCRAFGVPGEDRPFHPHVTLGRVRSLVSSDDLLSRMLSITLEGPTVRVGEILLVQSTLKPSGSVYRVVRRIPLGSA